MNALQTEITCPHMHDECNKAGCPQHKKCPHLLPAEIEVKEGTLDAVIIELSEHRRILHFLQESLEACRDVPDGLVSTLSLIRHSLQGSIHTLCELKASETA